jgi:hypothetical protein
MDGSINFITEDQTMSFIDDIGGAIGGAAGDLVGGALDIVGDVAQMAAPIAGLVNPVAGFALSAGGSFLESLTNDVVKQQESNCREGGGARDGNGRTHGGGEGGGCEAGSGAGIEGASVFEQLAVAMGDAMNSKLQDMLNAAESVSSGASGDEILKTSAQVTARGQELNAMSQAFNSAINSLGQAAGTAARKS